MSLEGLGCSGGKAMTSRCLEWGKRGNEGRASPEEGPISDEGAGNPSTPISTAAYSLSRSRKTGNTTLRFVFSREEHLTPICSLGRIPGGSRQEQPNSRTSTTEMPQEESAVGGSLSTVQQ